MVGRTLENIEVIGKEPLYQRFFRVDEYFFKYPHYNGEMSGVVSREVMERGNAAGILMYDPDRDQLVFVEQMRVGVFIANEHPWILECAAGIVDPGETPEQVVCREAREEAGAEVLEIEPIIEYFSSPGGLSEKIFLFCGHVHADQVADFAGLQSEDEDIRVVVMSAEEAEKRMTEGKFNNALTIIAMQWFMMNKANLRKKWGRS
ncbi:MAG: NUDIX domain-containing protein [Alphaproteobacteria bacterium]|nr:NUDIX domain-containing protein [Alphaproteobacteria bacterium]